MQIYHYSPDNGEFLRASDALIDPLESEKQGTDVYLIPAYATDIVPMRPGDNEAVVFNCGVWNLVDDFRGEWYLPTGDKIFINDLGVPLPAGATSSPPPLTLEEVKTAKLASVKAVAQGKINNIIPQGWRQMNSMARSVELVKLMHAGPLPTAEQSELDDLQAKWDLIKAIRTASDVIEAEIDALTTKAAVEGYDVSGSSHWPA